MSAEITVSHTLTVQKKDSTGLIQLVNFNRSEGFRADLAGSSGPYVGSVNVRPDKSLIDLSAAGGGGGVIWVKNQSGTATIQLGLYDVSTNTFDPVMDFLPGECWPFRVSRDIGREEIPGTGTGGSTGNKTQLALKGDKTVLANTTAPAEVAYFPK